jgi:hypothetical protein
MFTSFCNLDLVVQSQITLEGFFAFVLVAENVSVNGRRCRGLWKAGAAASGGERGWFKAQMNCGTAFFPERP